MVQNTDTTTHKTKSTPAARFRKWSRWIHRDLSYFFAGILIIYCISGVYMNHRDTVNVHYTVERLEFSNTSYSPGTKLSEQQARDLIAAYGLTDAYTKHYYPKEDYLKIFIKGGSSLELNQKTGDGVVEILSKRPLVSDMVKLHYNPGKWWTWFSDFFCIAMIIVVITGFTMMKGSNGLVGRGGLLLLAGILVPIIILFTV